MRLILLLALSFSIVFGQGTTNDPDNEEVFYLPIRSGYDFEGAGDKLITIADLDSTFVKRVRKSTNGDTLVVYFQTWDNKLNTLEFVRTTRADSLDGAFLKTTRKSTAGDSLWIWFQKEDSTLDSLFFLAGSGGGSSSGGVSEARVLELVNLRVLKTTYATDQATQNIKITALENRNIFSSVEKTKLDGLANVKAIGARLTLGSDGTLSADVQSGGGTDVSGLATKTELATEQTARTNADAALGTKIDANKAALDASLSLDKRQIDNLKAKTQDLVVMTGADTWQDVSSASGLPEGSFVIRRDNEVSVADIEGINSWGISATVPARDTSAPNYFIVYRLPAVASPGSDNNLTAAEDALVRQYAILDGGDASTGRPRYRQRQPSDPQARIVRITRHKNQWLYILESFNALPGTGFHVGARLNLQIYKASHSTEYDGQVGKARFAAKDGTGNLGPADDTVQELADAVDALTVEPDIQLEPGSGLELTAEGKLNINAKTVTDKPLRLTDLVENVAPIWGADNSDDWSIAVISSEAEINRIKAGNPPSTATWKSSLSYPRFSHYSARLKKTHTNLSTVRFFLMGATSGAVEGFNPGTAPFTKYASDTTYDYYTFMGTEGSPSTAYALGDRDGISIVQAQRHTTNTRTYYGGVFQNMNDVLPPAEETRLLWAASELGTRLAIDYVKYIADSKLTQPQVDARVQLGASTFSKLHIQGDHLPAAQYKGQRFTLTEDRHHPNTDHRIFLRPSNPPNSLISGNSRIDLSSVSEYGFGIFPASGPNAALIDAIDADFLAALIFKDSTIRYIFKKSALTQSGVTYTPSSAWEEVGDIPSSRSSLTLTREFTISTVEYVEYTSAATFANSGLFPDIRFSLEFAGDDNSKVFLKNDGTLEVGVDFQAGRYVVEELASTLNWKVAEVLPQFADEGSRDGQFAIFDGDILKFRPFPVWRELSGSSPYTILPTDQEFIVEFREGSNQLYGTLLVIRPQIKTTKRVFFMDGENPDGSLLRYIAAALTLNTEGTQLTISNESSLPTGRNPVPGSGADEYPISAIYAR